MQVSGLTRAQTAPGGRAGYCTDYLLTEIGFKGSAESRDTDSLDPGGENGVAGVCVAGIGISAPTAAAR